MVHGQYQHLPRPDRGARRHKLLICFNSLNTNFIHQCTIFFFIEEPQAKVTNTRLSLMCHPVEDLNSIITFYVKNQSSERPVRSESLKLWTVKILLFLFFDSHSTRLIQNKQIRQYQGIFIKPAEYTRTTSGTIGRQVMFHYKTWCIPLEVFTSRHCSLLKSNY